jgi:hypothetical protein
MTKFYYFRVSGSITLEMYVPEGEISRNGSEIAPTKKAIQTLERELKDLLDRSHPVESLSLDEVTFDREEEVE